MPPISKCNYYVKNQTVVIFDFTNQYGGIPQNLLFNLIGWLLLVGLFAVLRRSAGNFGRLALARKDDENARWTQLFFAPDEVGSGGEDEAAGIAAREEILGEPDSLASIDYSEVDSSFCSWVTSIFTLSDDKFNRKCGVDAVQYMKFQRHLILLVLIEMIVCIGIILPINFQVKL